MSGIRRVLLVTVSFVVLGVVTQAMAEPPSFRGV
jgi:hypothetical protein